MRSGRPLPALAALLAVTAAAWFAYVPVHEFAHVLGCLLAGGEIREMALSPLYGGGLLASRVGWIVAGGDHAGRITSFSTGRSDLAYLATDAAPYLLSILAVPLLRLAGRRRSILLAGLAVVPALAPFLGLPGDYFEMGSVIVTRTADPLGRPPDPGEEPPGWMRLRSDDALALAGRILEEPGEFTPGVVGGLTGVAGGFLFSAILGLLLAFATYALGDLLAGSLLRGPPQRSAAAGGRGNSQRPR